MKKLMSVVLAFMLAISAFGTTAFADAITFDGGVLTQSIKKSDVADDEFYCTYNLDNKSGFWSIGFKIGFDNDILELVSIENNTQVFITDDEWLVPTDEVLADANKNGEFIYTAQASTKFYNITESGDVCKVLFRFKDTTYKDKKTNISTYALGGYNLHVENDQVYDASLSCKSAGAFSYNSLNTPVLLGDVDGNGKISVADAREIVVAIANNTPLDVLVADVNKDGKVSVADARKIVVAIAKG